MRVPGSGSPKSRRSKLRFVPGHRILKSAQLSRRRRHIIDTGVAKKQGTPKGIDSDRRVVAFNPPALLEVGQRGACRTVTAGLLRKKCMKRRFGWRNTGRPRVVTDDDSCCVTEARLHPALKFISVLHGLHLISQFTLDILLNRTLKFQLSVSDSLSRQSRPTTRFVSSRFFHVPLSPLPPPLPHPPLSYS